MTQSTGSDGSGYQVDPSQLTTFAGYLSNTTGKAVTQAGDDVKSANGFDNNAFGILMAQFWSAPVRIDMAVVHDKIMGDLTNSINDVANLLKQNVTNYGQQETDTSNSFQNIKNNTNFSGQGNSNS